MEDTTAKKSLTLKELKAKHKYDGLSFTREQLHATLNKLLDEGKALEDGSFEYGYGEVVNVAVRATNMTMNAVASIFGMSGEQAGFIPQSVLYMQRRSDKNFKVIEVEDSLPQSYPYDLDDPVMAPKIIIHWQNGTASHFETQILGAISRGDAKMRERIRTSFPVLVKAYEDWYAGHTTKEKSN